MPRLILLWDRPQHLSDADASRWIHGESQRLTAVHGVARAELTRLRPASDRHRGLADWMLELHLDADADGVRCLAAEPCRAWLADLTLLGMHPAAALAADGLRVDRGTT